jgi:hypothetical protein
MNSASLTSIELVADIQRKAGVLLRAMLDDGRAVGSRLGLPVGRGFESLTSEVETICSNPRMLTDLVDFYEALSSLMAPATAETIEFSETYSRGAQYRNSSGIDGNVGRWVAAAVALRFRALLINYMTLLIIVATLIAVVYVAVGQGRVTELDTAVAAWDNSLKEGSATTSEIRTRYAVRNLEILNNFGIGRGNWDDSDELLQGVKLRATSAQAKAVWSDRFRITAGLVLPIALAFLGAYASLTRWLNAQVESRCLRHDVGALFVNRFALALMAGLLIGGSVQNLPNLLIATFWPVLIPISFFAGYFVTRLFGWLDSIGGGRAGRALVKQLESSMNDGIDKAVGKIFATRKPVNYTGKVGIDIVGSAESVLRASSADAASPAIIGRLIPRTTYTLIVRIGRQVGELAVSDILSVVGGVTEREADFDVEVEGSQMDIAPRTTTLKVETRSGAENSSAIGWYKEYFDEILQGETKWPMRKSFGRVTKFNSPMVRSFEV